MYFITSRDNLKIKEYVRLSAKKSERDKSGLFCFEGMKLVEEAFLSGIEFEMIFVTSACFSKNSDFLEKLFQSAPFAEISDEISGKITMQESPQGIYAVCKKHSVLDKQIDIDKIYTSGKYIFLCGLQDAGNVGTIIRTAEALGLDGIILSNTVCDIYSHKVIRGSMGSVFRIPFLTVSSIEDFLKALSLKNVSTYASVIDENANPVIKTEFSKPCVLLIGNEGNGLESDVVKLCSNRVTIKMQGSVQSLNASMAACILMWEMMK